VNSLSFSHNSKLLAAGVGEPREVMVWDVTTGKVLRRIPEAGPLVAFAPEGAVLASAWTYGKDVFLWDALTGAATGKLPANMLQVGCFAFARDGKLAVAGRDQQRKARLMVWHSASAALVYETRVPVPIAQVAFASDNRHVFTVDDQGTILVFRLASAFDT
jgi:WD40 repeat protein